MRCVWQPLAIVAGLLLLLTYLLIQSQSPDPGLRTRLQEALQSMQLHDTELTRDVLLARAGLLPHYDALPRTGQHLWRALEALRAESATVAGPAAREMRQHVETLATVLRQKLTLVEYFTSDNALLQNSVMYLTYTGQTLGARLAVEQAVTADIAALSHAMLRFMHTPEQGVGTKVEAALQRLATVAVSQPYLQTLVAHGRLIRGYCRRSTRCYVRLSRLRARLGSMPSRMPCCSMPTGSRHAHRCFGCCCIWWPSSCWATSSINMRGCGPMLERCAVPMPTCAPARNASVPSRKRRMTPSFPPTAPVTLSPGIRGRKPSSVTRRQKFWALP
jgi:DAHL domain-containing protein